MELNPLKALQELSKQGVEILILKHKLMGWILIEDGNIKVLDKEKVMKHLENLK